MCSSVCTVKYFFYLSCQSQEGVTLYQLSTRRAVSLYQVSRLMPFYLSKVQLSPFLILNDNIYAHLIAIAFATVTVYQTMLYCQEPEIMAGILEG